MFFRLRVCAAAILFFLNSCNRRQAPETERLAVLPFENLTADPSLDGLGRAAAAALVDELSGAPQMAAFQAGSLREAYSARASRFVEAYLTADRGDLSLQVVVEGRDTRKSVRNLVVRGPMQAGVLPLVERIAKDLSPAARPFSTANDAAVRSFGDGDFKAATEADPNFATAWVAWAEASLARGDRAAAERIARAGLERGPRPIDKARLEFLANEAAGKQAEREQALQALAGLTPADANVFRSLGEVQQAERKFPEAVSSYRQAVKLDGEDPALYNMLGYAQAFAQDLDGARRSLAEYRKLAPAEEANALDSLGEVSFYLGDFAQAEKYFTEAHQKNGRLTGGAELLKAAEARLMTGDAAGADGLFARYAEFRKSYQPALAEFERAQWKFMTGRRREAMAALADRLLDFDADSASYALSQISIWKLQTGDRTGASAAALDASARAVSPATRGLSAMCRFLAEGGSQSGSKLADVYSLLLAGRYAEALPALQELYRETNPAADGQARTLLAWAYVKTGQAGLAKPLLALFPIPLPTREPVFAALEFPRFLALKGALDPKYQALFQKYAGDAPDAY